MKQDVAGGLDIRHGWTMERAGLLLNGRGDRALLSRPMAAFFSSRACPASAVRVSLEWALVQTRARMMVISGFHSPLERSVMTLLLEAGSPMVAVIGRDPTAARLPAQWNAALRRGGLVVVSAAPQSARLTAQRAIARNDVVARLAAEITVGHASIHGELGGQIRKWQVEECKKVSVLFHLGR